MAGIGDFLGGGGGAGIGGLVGGLLGGNAAKMDRAHQKQSMADMIAEYKKIGYPPDYAKELVLQQFQSAGLYTPELEQDLNDTIAESQVAQISEDPALRQAQTSALSSMQQRGKVGLSAEDRAALNQIRQQGQVDAQAKQGQILQEMQARGMGGSGSEMMARLQSAQSGADRASTQSDAVMAQAQEKALQALAQSGQMAGNIRTQDFNNAQAKANALDERNRFLANNSIDRQTRNVGATNNAQQQNLAKQQSIANANVDLANQEKQRQATANQQTYADKLRYAAGITGQQAQQAQYFGDQANAKAQAAKDMGQGVGQMAGSAAMMMSDENLKENVDYTDDSVQKWLDSLSTKILRK